MDADKQPPYVVVANTFEQQACICHSREEIAMHESTRSQPVALRCQEITEQDVATLRRLAEDPNPSVGVLDWVPQRLPKRKRATVNS